MTGEAHRSERDELEELQVELRALRQAAQEGPRRAAERDAVRQQLLEENTRLRAEVDAAKQALVEAAYALTVLLGATNRAAAREQLETLRSGR